MDRRADRGVGVLDDARDGDALGAAVVDRAAEVRAGTALDGRPDDALTCAGMRPARGVAREEHRDGARADSGREVLRAAVVPDQQGRPPQDRGEPAERRAARQVGGRRAHARRDGVRERLLRRNARHGHLQAAAGERIADGGPAGRRPAARRGRGARMKQHERMPAEARRGERRICFRLIGREEREAQFPSTGRRAEQRHEIEMPVDLVARVRVGEEVARVRRRGVGRRGEAGRAAGAQGFRERPGGRVGAVHLHRQVEAVRAYGPHEGGELRRPRRALGDSRPAREVDQLVHPRPHAFDDGTDLAVGEERDARGR